MTSRHGHSICITGLLWAKFIGYQWIPLTKRQWSKNCVLSLLLPWTSWWNIFDGGETRCATTLMQHYCNENSRRKIDMNCRIWFWGLSWLVLLYLLVPSSGRIYYPVLLHVCCSIAMIDNHGNILLCIIKSRWVRETHICVNDLSIIASEIGLARLEYC